MKKFYSVKEVQGILGGLVSVATIYNLIRKGQIPAVRFGNRALIPAYWVEEFCESAHCTPED